MFGRIELGQTFGVAIVLLLAFVGSLTLTPLARRLAWKFGAVSEPDGKRKLHERPTALWGGGAVYLALVLSLVASVYLVTGGAEQRLPAALALSAGMLCLLGFFDDLYELRARWKLVGQIVSTLPVLAAGCYVQRLVVFGCPFDVGLLGIVWTVGWLVLGINALNLLDGVDGLASLMGILVSLAIGLIAATQSRPEVMLLAFALAGALAGFLVHNLPPARVYLGDCGSMVIGFTLALLALRVSCWVSDPMSSDVTVAAALLFVPLLDTALAIVRRTLKGCHFMRADHSHIHHQLLRRGLSVWQVLGVLGGFGLIAGAAAWWVAVTGQELAAWAVLVAATILLANRRLLGAEEWLLTKRFVQQTATPSILRLLPRNPSGSLLPANPANTPGVSSDLAEPVVLMPRRPEVDLGANVEEVQKAA